ncbi:MAG: LytR/AlgR family response regulator transcription factor [Chitinophagaceae bacterium]
MQLAVNCIIVEDEQPAIELLEKYIADIDFLHLKGSFKSATKAMAFLSTQPIDLVFSDINLPGMSGISLMQSLSHPPAFIFTTAHEAYAVKSFELEAVDYLLKPISFERFLKAVNRYLKQRKTEWIPLATPEVAKPTTAFIFVRCDKKMVKVMLDEIVYFEAQKNNLLIYTTKSVLRTYHSISEMEEKIPGHLFLRLHRSFIVALSKIETYTGADVQVVGGTTIPIGRNYALAAATELRKLME